MSVGHTEILRPVSAPSIEADTLEEEITVSQTIRNVQRVSQAYAVTVQIVDEEGFTRSLTWSTGLLAAGEEAQVEHSWVAEHAGRYEI